MSRSASDVLSQEFLQIRAKILDVAAFFDRFEAADAPGSAVGADQQMKLLVEGCELLTDGHADKAARLQLLFSRQYQPDWRETFEI